MLSRDVPYPFVLSPISNACRLIILVASRDRAIIAPFDLTYILLRIRGESIVERSRKKRPPLRNPPDTIVEISRSPFLLVNDAIIIIPAGNYSYRWREGKEKNQPPRGFSTLPKTPSFSSFFFFNDFR